MTRRLLDVDDRDHILEHVGEFAADEKNSVLRETSEAVFDYEHTLTAVGALVERVCVMVDVAEKAQLPMEPGSEGWRRLRTMLERARALSRPIADGRTGAQIAAPEPKDEQTLDVFDEEKL